MFNEMIDLQLSFFFVVPSCKNNGTRVFSKNMVMHLAHDTIIKSVWLVRRFCHLLA